MTPFLTDTQTTQILYPLPLQVQALTRSPLFWKYPPSPLITEIGGNWSFYSVSKIPVVSKPSALTKSAVDTPSTSHEVFIIPD